MAAWAAAVVGGGWLLPATALLGWTLLCLAVIDARHLILPDALTLPLLLLGLVVAALLPGGRLVDHGIGAAVGFLAFAAVGAIYRRLRGRDGLGLGDAKLLAAAGAWVGWAGLPGVVLIAAALGLLATLALRMTGRGGPAEAPVPFGPWLCAAIWCTWLYGPLQFRL